MNRTETAQLLTFASGYDGREVSETEVVAWHRVLEPIAYETAIEAVASHYRSSHHRMMPADITRYAREVGNDRAMRAALPAAGGVADADTIARIRAAAEPYTVEDDAGVVLWRGDRRKLAEVVNADPDARAALAEPPLNYTNWSGYVPPRVYDGRHNDSPVRARLLLIVAHALDRRDRDRRERAS